MSSQIAVYAGEGVDPFCLEAINRQLRDIANLNCHKIDLFKEPNDLWKDPSSLRAIVVPGGNAAMMWSSCWKDQAFVIQKYMEAYPISYYGICAGAILATSACFERRYFTEENHFNNAGYKFLGICPLFSVAPTYFVKERSDLTIADFKTPFLNYSTESVQTAHITGPAFLDCDKLAGTFALSSYPDLMDYTFIRSSIFRPNYATFDAGVVKSNRIFETIFYEKFRDSPIILTGSHLEIDSKALTSEFFETMFQLDDEKEQQKLVASFKKGDELRRKILQTNFEKLHISCI